ncbi:MAG: heavy-metal-associated domain-containing protein [Pararhodobacter sp.]
MPDVTTFSVPDMSCGHCRASIETALKTLGAVPVAFDMDKRRVSVAGPVSPEAVVGALEAIGFDATATAD